MSKFETETIHRIYDEHGDYLEIGEDADGLGLVEIRSYSKNILTNSYVVGMRIAVHPDAVDLLIAALSRFSPTYNKGMH